MTLALLGDREVHVNEEGFLTDPGEWDEQLAHVLAANIGIELTDDHLAVLRFLRADHAVQGETPTLRRVTRVGGFDMRRLFELFPGKPARKMAYVAGLPKPVGCV